MGYYWSSRTIAVVLAAALLAGACSSDSGDEDPRPKAVKPSATAAPAPSLPSGVIAEIGTRAGSNFLAVAGEGMWVSETDAGSVARIDSRTNKVTYRIHLGHAPDFMTEGFRDLWVTSSAEGLVWRINPNSGEVVARGRVPLTAYGLNPGFGSMWVADHDANKLFELDPKSAKALDSVKVPSAADVVAGFGSLWVASEEQKVYEIDPATLDVVNVIKVDAAHAIAVAYGAVWVSAGGEGDVVTRIDPKTGERVAEIETTVAGFPDRMAAAGGLLWVGQYQAPTILGIDPETNEVAKELPAGSGAAVVWSAFDDLWVANFNDATVWRLNPER